MRVAFVLDKDANNRNLAPKGPDVRLSPFVEYALTAPDFADKYISFSIEEAQVISRGTHDFCFLFPIGVYRYFHRAWISSIMRGAKEIQPFLDLLARVKSIRDVNIIFDLSWEVASQQQIEAIPTIAQMLNIPVKNILLFSNNPMSEYLSGSPLRYGYRVFGAWFFEFYTHAMHSAELSAARAFVKEKAIRLHNNEVQFTKLFVSLNRRMRYHRLLLAAFLNARGLIERAYFSFGGKDGNPADNYLRQLTIEKVRKLASIPSVAKLVTNSDIDKILTAEPFELDVTFSNLRQDSNEFNANAVATSDKMLQCYRDSLFSIVTETDYGSSSNEFLLTEKTFKPILFGHPVLLMSGPGAMLELRRLGYRGYSPSFDESYDYKYDPVDRFLSLAQAVDSAISQLEKGPAAFMARLNETIEFNQDNFIDGTPGRLADFVSRIGSEILRFRHLTSQLGDVDSARERSGKVGGAGDGEYEIIASESDHDVQFDGGFYEYEPLSRGRWCSGSGGALVLWLADGDWEVTLSLGSTPEHAIPSINVDGLRREPSAVKKIKDKTTLTILLKNVRQFTTLRFLSKTSFVLAKLKSDSTDARILSFWLAERILVRKLA